jgi:hypothetical protein
LRAARNLKFLELYDTVIDDEHYGLLLSALPNVANIRVKQNTASILCATIGEGFDTIAHAKGNILDIGTLLHERPNTTNISMYHKMRHLHDLSAFKALRVLEIHTPGYIRSYIKTLLQGVGHRLTVFKLFGCRYGDIQDIVTLCPSLTDLSLTGCHIYYQNRYTLLDPQLPHFRNLINLEICDLHRYPNDFPFFSQYVSVKTVELKFRPDFDRFVREILNLGTYNQLEVLRVQETAPRSITKKALELLIEHCPLLKRIELVAFAGDSEEYDLEELKRQMLLQNFDLKFKLITPP